MEKSLFRNTLTWLTLMQFVASDIHAVSLAQTKKVMKDSYSTISRFVAENHKDVIKNLSIATLTIIAVAEIGYIAFIKRQLKRERLRVQQHAIDEMNTKQDTHVYQNLVRERTDLQRQLRTTEQERDRSRTTIERLADRLARAHELNKVLMGQRRDTQQYIDKTQINSSARDIVDQLKKDLSQQNNETKELEQKIQEDGNIST